LPAIEPSEDPRYVIRVDRTRRPIYPSWIKRLVHPELECVGPTEFNLFAIDRALNLQDGLAFLREQRVFREVFGERKVFLFMSLGEDCLGRLHVPFVISSDGGSVVLDWSWTSRDWGAECPDLHFVRVTP